jgi:sugar-specific transcriptional regulator TrmB
MIIVYFKLELALPYLTEVDFVNKLLTKIWHLCYNKLMLEVLKRLDFSDKESKIYLHLVSNPPLTAAELAKQLRESRTNIYMVLDKLVQRGVIVADDTEPVRRFAAADPSSLQNLVKIRQREIIVAKQALDTTLPDLISAFNLGQQRPGVVSQEGVEGLKASMNDMGKSKTDLLVWGSDIANQQPEVWKIIETAGYKRRSKGINTRCLFHNEAITWPHIQEFKDKGFDVRIWGDKPFIGEVVVYDNKVAITNYADTIIVTTLTHQVIADTFRTIFENCWQAAEKLPS